MNEATARVEPPVTEGAPPRASLEIDPRPMVMNNDGFAWRSFLVRLPEGMIADDLKEPGIWRKIQISKWSLRKFDQLLLVAHDESWIAEAVVAESDNTKVVLAKPRITTFPPRFTGLFQDEKYRVKWSGAGFFVERKADNHRMTQDVAAAGHAERDLRQLYPRPV